MSCVAMLPVMCKSCCGYGDDCVFPKFDREESIPGLLCRDSLEKA